MVFNYCERTSITIFDEPVNTVSNLAFILCGLYLIFKKKKKSSIFPYLIIFIGIGSFLYHLKPTPLFATLDVLAIVLFIFFYNYYLNKKVFLNSIIHSIFSSILLILVSFYFGKLLMDTILATSSFYVILLIYMICMLIFLNKKPKKSYFTGAIILFFISIFFRSLDQYTCKYLSFGSHFI